jgi:DNA-binding HxlR family transcriptional regulator
MKKQKVSGKKAEQVKRSVCPITNTLDILGDKWTLLVVRDMFLGKKTYGEFLESPEGIPTNILADRLKRLAQYGIINKTPYQQAPVRYAYQLTPKGQELSEVMKAIIKWGLENIPGTRAVMKDRKKIIKKRTKIRKKQSRSQNT